MSNVFAIPVHGVVVLLALLSFPFNTTSAGDTEIVITGKVIDFATNQPLPAVNIVVEGTNVGTITDADGNYSISVNDNDAILTFSFVGYKNEKIKVDNQVVIDVALIPNHEVLTDIVVIGYGQQKIDRVTSSIASVNAVNFIKAPVKDAGQLLQGKVAGLTVISPSGDPTSGVQILLRGNTTIKGANINPLILIDGIPGDLNTVAPEDIDAIDVLKDGSAAAIYGVRGNNGVILVTTKKFKSAGEMTSVEYSTQFSTQQVTRQLDMLTAQDYKQQIAEGVRSASWNNGSNTNWFKAATRTPLSQIHNLNFRGGNAKTNYLVNLNYRGFEGIMIKSDNKTFNGRIEVNHSMFNNKLKFNFGIIGKQNSSTATTDSTGFNMWVYRQLMIQNPTSPIKDAQGNWFQEGIFDYDNPLAQLHESDGRAKTQYTRYNARIVYNPMDGLTLSSNIAYDKSNSFNGYAETKKNISTTRDGKNGYVSLRNDQGAYRFAEFIAEYKTNIANHDFSILAGYGYQENELFGSRMNNYDFPTDKFGYSNIGLGKALADGRANMLSDHVKTNLISFFGRVSYSFKDKYLLLASVRREAASQLYGAKYPWGTFPAVSVGWRINKESFASDLTFLSNLKLRAGYGVTGNMPKDLFLGVATLTYADYFPINGNWIRSLAPNQNPNPNLRWEEKKEYNVGLEYGLFNDRVYGNLDFYVRRIDGLLYEYQVPSPPNLKPSTMANVGVMENKGIELTLSVVPVKTNNLNWTSQILYSTNTNKLVSLSNDLYQMGSNYFTTGNTGVPIQTFTHIVEIGDRLGNFYGYKVVDATSDGYWIYETKNGERVDYTQFSRSFEDKKIIGNGIPKFHAGWNNTFNYKNVDLSITMRGSFGHQILNSQRMYYENTGDDRYNRLASAYDKVFDKAVLNKNQPLELNSYYIEKGNFWKIDNIVLGYNFNHLRYARTARVFVSTLNTFIITKYKGIDPEVNWTGLAPGVDSRDKYPSTRSFTVGASIMF
jgi:TonB-dependent starch-binding outer membrane protein SusC